jgi:predicted transcriptional regulator
MITLGVGSVVVLEDGRLDDVADVMELNPVVIEPDLDLPRTTVIMADKAIRRPPVVEEDGRFVGLLAQWGPASWFASEDERAEGVVGFRWICACLEQAEGVFRSLRRLRSPG